MEIQNHGLHLDDLLTRLSRALRVQFFRNANGLTASQVFVTSFLSKRERAKASEIAKVAGLSPGAVTQVCDELVRLGLVERERSDADRRVVYVQLTEAGRQRVEQIRRQRAERIMDIVRQLEQEEVETFERVLHKVVGILETQDSHPGGNDSQ
jgi:DNA-binding MarR family transcriptional regulator